MIRRLFLPLCAAAVSILFAGACDVPVATDVAAITSETWAKMITDIGKKKTATQKMAASFLYIRKGDNVDYHRNNLKSYVNDFADFLVKFHEGKGGYSKPPLTMICDGIEIIMENWPQFKAILEPATVADAVLDYDDNLMGNLSHWGDKIMGMVDLVTVQYVSVAKFYSPTTPGQKIDLAERQVMLSQKMAKASLLVFFQYNTYKYLGELQVDLNIYDRTHDGLLKGINFIGVTALRARCTIWEMRYATDRWNTLRASVQNIIDTQQADEALVESVEYYATKLLASMNRAVDLFVEDLDDCEEFIDSQLDFTAWANGINEAGRGQMFSQKSARLILQVAQPNPANLKIDQDELIDTLAVGLWTLNILIEGSVARQVSALPTQVLVREFVDARETWNTFSTTLTANSVLLPISGMILDRVANLRMTYYNQMAGSVYQYVYDAQAKAPDVHSEVIFIAGRQRSLQCKLASESLFTDLDCQVERHRRLAAESIALYLSVHWKLLLGEKDAEGNTLIKRTTNICMLDQMLTVIDQYTRIRGITGLIMESSKDTSSKDDLQSFHEIINAGYGIMNAAVEMYIADGATCTLQPQSEDWDAALLELSALRSLVEKVTKDFLFTTQGLNTTNGDIYLDGCLAEMRETLHRLTYGSTAHNIPTPPSQPAAYKLFDVTDAFKELEPRLMMGKDATRDDVLIVAGKSEELAQSVQELMELYIDDAWEKDKGVAGARQNASGSLVMAIERAQKQVAFLQFPACDPCKVHGGKILDTINFFEDTYDVLLNGNVGARRLANGTQTKTTVRYTNEESLLNLLGVLRTQFNQLKPVLEVIVEERSTSDEYVPLASTLIEVGDRGQAAAVTMQEADAIYSTSSRTTTSVYLDVLTPLPLTGDWAVGRTMRTAARMAEQIINYQQKVMPGFAIKSHFFDDQCDSQEGMRLVLQESASVTTDYVALGGMGCSHVCASAAFASASMNMPFLSYECSARGLSDEVEYVGFTRMGTPLTQSLEMLKTVVEQYGWRQISIVSGDAAQYRDQVDVYQVGLADMGVQTAYYSSFDATVDETLAMVKGFVSDKRRQIMLIGSESFMRRVICGSIVAGANLGITWMYEGIMSEKWWTYTDANLLAEQPECTAAAIMESFVGAINFAGLGRALPHEEELPLNCFEGYNSKDFLTLLDEHLADGYPTKGDNETMIARPHMELRAHTADGVCALALTIAHFLIDHTVDEMRNPTTTFYEGFVAYLKTGLAFQGVSGWVNFTGNDKPETISMKQVLGEEFVMVGMAFPNGSMLMNMHGGLTNDSWAPAKADAEESFPWLVFKVLTPLLCVCCPAIAGCIRNA